jgi:hypothetical protein
MFEINREALGLNVAGITDEEALVQPRPDANCINWIVGHIVSSRSGILKLLGEEQVWPPEMTERYKRGSAPVRGSAEGKPLSVLLSDLDRSQERILRGIAALDESRWEEPQPTFGTLRRALFFLQFHEAYHVGQTGVLRRLIGKEGAIR